MTTPDFYTIGYSGRSIEQFIATLQEAGVKTLVDVRHLPLSRHKPDFGKARLSRRVEQEGLGYVQILWARYDNRVLGFRYDDTLLRPLVDCQRPFALIYRDADPVTCHRHRLALALERLGLKGVDL